MAILNIFFVVCMLNLCNSALSETQCPNVKDINDRRIEKNKVRIMQYNVEWLFIDYYASSDCPGNGCTWKNQTHALQHLESVAHVINDLDPDIINFCEVEGCDELNMVNDAVIDSEKYVPYLIKGSDTSTGQNVGMLTKIDPNISLYRDESRYYYPINDSKCGYNGDYTSTAVSKHYITEFFINNVNIAFISIHLIAIPTDPQRCAQREAQAAILQSIIYNYVINGYEVIMIGDLNDYDADIPDINSNKPASMVLDILKGNAGPYNGTYQLYSAGAKIAQEERYSEWWDSDNNCDTMSVNDYSLIDHILMSPKIEKIVNNVSLYHEYNEYCGKINSDHYPLIIDLVF
jgi:exonuclease III